MYMYIHIHISISLSIYIYMCMCIYEKGNLWCPDFWHILWWKSAFRIGETLHFFKICCFIDRKHHLSKQAFRLGHIHVFKFMRCFAMAKQHFQHARVNQKISMGNRKPWIKPRQPRFQNQWIAKTIENTKQIKKTRISEPMGSKNNWDSCFLVFFGILDGFRYSLVLKSWFSCFFFVF